jgi:hypothetical protein
VKGKDNISGKHHKVLPAPPAVRPISTAVPRTDRAALAREPGVQRTFPSVRVAAVTLGVADAERATRELRDALDEASVAEFKWVKLRTAQTRFAVLRLIDYVLIMVAEEGIRVDALTGDTHDSRHSVPGRSDSRNLRRMYYFLLRNVLGRRWPEECVWELRPDQHSDRAASHLGYLGLPEELSEDARRAWVRSIRDIESHQEPLVQVADLFAGMAAYSRTSFGVFEQWYGLYSAGSGTPPLGPKLSNSDKERCAVLYEFYRRCKEEKLGVGLMHSRGLRTRDPGRPLNFWWYELQGDYDQAPVW